MEVAIRPGVDVVDEQSWVQDVDRRIRGKVIQLYNNQATNVKFRLLVVYISPSSSSSLEPQIVSGKAYERSHRTSGRALVQVLVNRLYAPCSLIQPKTQRSPLSQYRLQIPQ